MNLNLLMAIMSFFSVLISIIGTLNSSTKKKYHENIINYSLERSIVFLRYFLDFITKIIKSYSDGILSGIVNTTLLILGFLINFFMDLFEFSIWIIKFIFSKRMINLISKAIYLVLFLSTMWTGYFLYMGLQNPDNVEYYNNVSSMIVSVATMFSILVGFYEFRKTKD
ncbi:hypothetical protein FSZ06_06155 [Enterococcus gallinarum]|nr:hypothetical protein FSZ06_06155 [Enterococcus gallinarum]